MKVIYGLGKINGFGHPFVALGIFDGLHLGHEYILKTMARRARALRKKTICVTFFPHPVKILSSKHIFVNLISLRHRLKFISALGIDVCVVISFNRRFARIGPDKFINLLKERLNPSAVFVGDNFTFGSGGKGNVRILKRLAIKNNFDLTVFRPLKLYGKVISSTLIRLLISEGKLNLAKKYLGRNVSILGKVIKGKRVGRKLGYHSANIDTEHEVIPPTGIYAVIVTMGDKKYPGIAYIGTSPTMHFHFVRPRLEIYILNFNKNIYGREIETEFIKKIRSEKTFSSKDKLVAAIKNDIAKAKSLLSCHKK